MLISSADVPVVLVPFLTNISLKSRILFICSPIIYRIVLMEDAMDCLMSFKDFIYAFQIQFYYEGEPGYYKVKKLIRHVMQTEVCLHICVL